MPTNSTYQMNKIIRRILLLYIIIINTRIMKELVSISNSRLYKRLVFVFSVFIRYLANSFTYILSARCDVCRNFSSNFARCSLFLYYDPMSVVGFYVKRKLAQEVAEPESHANYLFSIAFDEL